MARSRRLAIAALCGTAACAIACQAIVGLDKFQKYTCMTDCGTDAAPDVIVTVDAGPDVIVFGDASVANRWIKWPMPNPKDGEVLVNVASYDAAIGKFPNGDEAILDDITHLTWMKSALAMDSFYVDAVAECEKRGLRLPTRIELVSLLDYTKQPAFDPELQGPGGAYWTQSPLPNQTSVWVVDFGTTPGVTTLGVDKKAFVRCVK